MATEQQTYAEPEVEGIEKDQYIVFKIHGQEYAFQAIRVQEISRPMPTTQVPTAPPYIEGILNLRGQLATVINFRRKFGFALREPDEDTRIIMVERGGFPIGVMVDSVEEVIGIPDDRVQALPEAAATPLSEEYVVGVGMMDKRLIVILDADKLLSKRELVEVEAARRAAGAGEAREAA